MRVVGNLALEFVCINQSKLSIRCENMPNSIGLYSVLLGKRVKLQAVDLVVVDNIDSIDDGDPCVLIPFLIFALVRLLSYHLL